MPLVKIDYVVSFSSEDPENPASNLLLPDVKSKWLCNVGESSCSVVLQLKNACKIDSITIGAFHVALIEVLVGLSETPNEPFQVLVPSCVLQAPGEARRGARPEVVRSFGAAQLAGAASRRWDRVRLVCAQPYNKHCKFGLAFVHISSPDARPAPLRLDAEAGSSDDEFRPGELFARRRRPHGTALPADAQIRQASSLALKNIADESTKLTKTPIRKTSGKRLSSCDERTADRSKQSLLYTADDARPHAKIDRLVRQHYDSRNRPHAGPQHCGRGSTSAARGDSPDGADTDARGDNAPSLDDCETNEAKDADNNKLPEKTDTARDPENATAGHKKRKRSEEADPECPAGEAPAGEVLAGVVLTMSGYVNPRRAALRDAALRMGARYLRDWRPDCTHLICAFPGTPKLRALRAAGARTRPVRAEWLEQCARRRRRLPWRPFATEPQQRRAPPTAHSSDGDTDDEIEKALQQQDKKQRRGSTASPPRPAPAASPAPVGLDASGDSDVAFVCDERLRAHITLHSDDDATDEDERAPASDSDHIIKELPAPWAGRTFVLSRALPAARAALLARYVRAHAGLALQEAEAPPDCGVDFVVAEAGAGAEAGAEAGAWAGARRVRPAWLWRALARRVAR